jgi:predicted SprT family Zn-dependent metalloprotease
MHLSEFRKITRAKLDAYRLTDWVFEYNNNKRRLGVCKFRHKRIEMQAYYVLHNSDSEIMDTLMHEIAHALVGPGYNHGPVWQAKAIEVGAIPTACNDNPDLELQEGNWITVCPNCKKEHHKHRRPKRLTGWHCVSCGPKFGRLLMWRHRDTIEQVSAIEVASARAFRAVCPGCRKEFVKPFLPPRGVFCQGENCGPIKGLLTFLEVV